VDEEAKVEARAEADAEGEAAVAVAMMILQVMMLLAAIRHKHTLQATIRTARKEPVAAEVEEDVAVEEDGVVEEAKEDGVVAMVLRQDEVKSRRSVVMQSPLSIYKLTTLSDQPNREANLFSVSCVTLYY
jgi:hypothetical protein